jgi:hypothetical protein
MAGLRSGYPRCYRWHKTWMLGTSLYKPEHDDLCIRRNPTGVLRSQTLRMTLMPYFTSSQLAPLKRCSCMYVTTR